MSFGFTVSFDPKPIENELTERFGIGSDAQYRWSEIVFNGGIKYMPMETATFINQSYILSEPVFDQGGLIFTGPQGHFLWEGVVYIDPETGSAWARAGVTKERTEIPLEYTDGMQTGGLRGARWTERAAADLMPVWEKELQGLIDAGKV